MSATDDPILPFLAAFGAGEADRIGACLDESVEWVVSGLPTMIGPDSIVRFWRRLLPRYRTVRVSLSRLVTDGEIRIAEQTHLIERREGGPLVLTNMAVYRLRQGRISHWADHVDLSSAPEAEVALWTRLRSSV